ncbi:MAG: gamma-glutamyl kinase, partial [Nitrosopumilus sp.]
MILIKLGGSIITNKEKPLSPRKKTIEKIAKNLRK